MNRVQKRFVKDALKQQYNLNEWEIKFINDLDERPDDFELSDKQNHTLNNIQRKLD